MTKGRKNLFDEKPHGVKIMKMLDEDGGSLVEFAVIAPLLLMILFGIMEFGILLYNQAVITNASREGARFGIVARTVRRTGGLEGEIATEIFKYKNYLISFSATTAPIIVETTPADTAGALFGEDLKVRVEWDYTFLLIPKMTNIGLSNPLTLSAETVMKYE